MRQVAVWWKPSIFGFGLAGSRGIRVVGGPCRRLTIFSDPVWRAQYRVGSGGVGDQGAKWEPGGH